MTARGQAMIVRLPFSAGDRATIQQPQVAIPASAGWPRDSVEITGSWIGAHTLRLRPIFPGFLRFLADDPITLPQITAADVVDGKLNDACIARLATVSGTLVVRILNASAIGKIDKIGRLAAIGMAPTHAYYSGLQLSEAFWRDALLDHRSGLGAGTVRSAPGLVRPGDPDWQRLMATGFLAGDYEAILYANQIDGTAAAPLLPMPALALGKGATFALKIALGWTPNAAQLPRPPALTPALEPIPVRAFLQHVAPSLGEEIVAAKGADALVVALLQEQADASAWHAALHASVHNLGFGSPITVSTLDHMIREFQIAAAGAFVATARFATTSDAQLRQRDFRDLRQIANARPYIGPMSGRANYDTRGAIADWSTRGLRNPHVIAAFAGGDVVRGRPTATAVAAIADVWKRQDTQDASLRMFAANFSKASAAGGINNATLEPVGRYAAYRAFGGPGGFPLGSDNRVAEAEVTPARLFGGVERDLIAALRDANPDPGLLKQASSFRVVRAVSEQECVGYLDNINAYDSAGISIGLFHTALALQRDAITKKRSQTTELGGLAAYFRYLDVAGVVAGADIFAPQGLGVKAGSIYFDPSPAGIEVRGAYMNSLCFVDDRGKARPFTSVDDVEFMGSWRTFYRFVEIARWSPSFGPALWAQALRRLKRIHEAPIVMDELPRDSRQTGAPTIGTVFTSELLMAWLLRWHVKLSVGVLVTLGNRIVASEYLIGAYELAAAQEPQTADEWQAALRTALLLKLVDFQLKHSGNADLTTNFADIENPSWVPPRAKNPRAYALDPELRRCSLVDRSFHLADQIADP